MSACSLVRWITSSGRGRSCPSPPGAAFPSMRWLKNTRHYQWNMKIIFSFLHFFSFKSTFINRRSSQATPCTWCWPPPSSTSLSLFLLSFSSTPGGTPFQNTFSLHFLHDGLKDLQITNHSSSSYSIIYSLLITLLRIGLALQRNKMQRCAVACSRGGQCQAERWPSWTMSS